ncbi:hypothetical protein KKI24_16535 [bacterium]|nr:hypothetical protein [bacterium]
MNKWLQKLEAMSMAVAFAEAGEWNTAEEIMDKQWQRQHPAKSVEKRKKTDKRPRMRT